MTLEDAIPLLLALCTATTDAKKPRPLNHTDARLLTQLPSFVCDRTLLEIAPQAAAYINPDNLAIIEALNHQPPPVLATKGKTQEKVKAVKPRAKPILGQLNTRATKHHNHNVYRKVKM